MIKIEHLEEILFSLFVVLTVAIPYLLYVILSGRRRKTGKVKVEETSRKDQSFDTLPVLERIIIREREPRGERSGEITAMGEFPKEKPEAPTVSVRGRLEGLPFLQRAVVMSEILGAPRALKEKDTTWVE
ncbi:MAG: hypothetical protein DRP87_11900 [Spirochaetes bacterium]|nr:MAG: hypothetical protein DRP87_11900 [Spirochaetota bacterium]